MADNVSITQGTGTTIATEDVSGVQHQKVKIEFGGDGVATLVSASDPLPVSATIDTTGLATDATDTNTGIIAGAITASRMQVDVISGGGGGTQYTEGDVDASITGTAAMMEVAGNTLQPVQGTVADGLLVNLGSNNDVIVTGSVTATQATGTNLHVVVDSAPTTAVTGTFYQATQPVSAASLPLPTGASTAAKQPALGTAGTPSADVITVQGVTSMTALKVDGSAVTQPVSGTFYQATQPVSLATLPALVAGSALVGKVSIDQVTANANEVVTKTGSVTAATLSAETTKVIGTVNVAAAQTIAVTNAGTFATQATLQTGSNAIGKLAANSGVDIGDVDVTSVITGTGATNLGKAEDAGHTTGDTGVFALGVRVDTPNTALTNTDADYSPIATNKLGSVRTAALEDDLATAATSHTYKYYTNAGAVTDGIIWSPAAGKRWFLTSLTINVSAAATVTIEDDVAAGDVVRFKFEFAANSGITIPFPEVPMFSGEDAADLLVTTSAGNVYITCVGYEI